MVCMYLTNSCALIIYIDSLGQHGMTIFLCLYNRKRASQEFDDRLNRRLGRLQSIEQHVERLITSSQSFFACDMRRNFNQ